MKHFVNILFLLLATLFCACSDELYFEHMSLTPRALGITAGGTLQTGKMSLTFEAEPSAQQSFNVKAVNTQWSIDNSASWLTLSTASGSESSTVILTAAPNPTIESRVAVLKLVSHEAELPVAREIIAVTQRGQVPYITPDENSVTFSGAAGNQEIGVATNLPEWEVATTDDWLTASRQGDKLFFGVKENTGAERRGYITIGKGETKATVTVTQHEANVTQLTSLDTYSVDGGTQTLAFKAEASWTASTTYSWIKIYPTSGTAGENTVTVEVARNSSAPPLSGSLYIYIGTKEKLRVEVSQQAKRIIAISCDDAINRSTPCSVTVSITSNGPWTAGVDKEWMSVSPTTGEGNAELTVSFTDNLSVLPRTGSLTVESDNEEATLPFTQPGKYLTLSASAVTFFANGGQAEPVDITTDGHPVASVPEDGWLKAEIKGGKLFITATPNTDIEPREGSVTVSLQGVTDSESLARTVTVTQEAGKVPALSAVTVNNIDKYSFTASATYTSDFEVTECGYCYSQTNSTPTIADTVIKAESLNNVTITGLTSARTYYIRAYAKSAVGIGYGEVKAVTTKGAKPGEDDNGMPAT